MRSLKAKKNALEALREARLVMIDQHRKKNGASHPYFWAGFVLAGKADQQC